MAIDLAKELFGADHANVQTHSGTQANQAAYNAWLEPGDTVLAMGRYLEMGAGYDLRLPEAAIDEARMYEHIRSRP